MNEAAALPSPAVLLSARVDRYYGRLRRPPGSRSTSRLNTGYRTRHSDSTNCRRLPGRGGPPQFPPPPSERSAPSTPGSFSGLRFQALRPFHGLRRERRGSALPSSHPQAGTQTARQASLHATDRSVAPPTGLLTLGSDPARFQTEPPACYRASWQLPGRDSHPQATTSFSWIRSLQTTTSNAGRTPVTWCKSSALRSSVKTSAAQAAWSCATSSLIFLSM